VVTQLEVQCVTIDNEFMSSLILKRIRLRCGEFFLRKDTQCKNFVYHIQIEFLVIL
jgi:hypothetical protein